MKSFMSPYPIDMCKAKLADLQSDGFLGFIRVKIKFIPMSDGNCHYVLWKTMRGNFGQDITLAEVNGELVRRDTVTVISGVSQMGRFYQTMFVLYGLVLIFGVISFVTSQKVSYLYFDVLLLGLTGFGWLLTFYWRNQLEGMVERALLT